MIVQGTNVPLAVTFDSDVSEIPTLVATLWLKDGSMVKQWNKADMQIEEDTAYLPLTEEETAAIAPGYVALEIKGLDDASQTIFWEESMVKVEGRRDREITLTEG